jgi:hypothetical protein
MMAGVAMVPSLRRLSAGLLAASLALLQGCATVFIRGILQDAAGEPIGGASIRLTSVASGKLVAEGVTNTSGCFNLHQFPPDEGRQFRLDITRAGYKAASYMFELSQNPVLQGTLAPDPSEKESVLVRLTRGQTYGTWQLVCDPPNPTGN